MNPVDSEGYVEAKIFGFMNVLINRLRSVGEYMLLHKSRWSEPELNRADRAVGQRPPKCSKSPTIERP
jgi:hypothetical protein